MKSGEKKFLSREFQKLGSSSFARFDVETAYNFQIRMSFIFRNRKKQRLIRCKQVPAEQIKLPISIQTCAQYSELPCHISTMGSEYGVRL